MNDNNIEVKNAFIEQYRLIQESEDVTIRELQDWLQKKLKHYFWPNERPESFGVYGRIKAADSTWKKIQRKDLDPLDQKNFLSSIGDILGLRIVVSRKSQIQRTIRLIEECNQFSIRKVEAFTNDLLEIEFYESNQISVSPAAAGYCGVHFDIEFKKSKHVERAEIQVRTKIQDAWQYLDHLLYKASERLPDSFVVLRKTISDQFEASEKTQQFIFKYIQEELLQNEPEGYGASLYFASDWSKKYGTPNLFHGKVIMGQYCDSFFYIDSELNRWLLVEEVFDDGHSRAVSPKFLKLNFPKLHDEVICVSDTFMASLVLAGLRKVCVDLSGE